MANRDNDGTVPAWRRPRQNHKEEWTHKPLREIRRSLSIGRVEGVLLWLSKTDPYVLKHCPYSTRLTLSALGMMVIFTTVLAFCSAYYTVSSTVVPPDASALIALVLAVIYAFGILLIDREIVGSTSDKALVIRFVFALLIATAVSYPVKLLFFEGRLETEINAMVDERNAVKTGRLMELKDVGEPERAQQLESVQARLDSLDREIAVLDTEIGREQQDVRCGPRCQGFRTQKEELMNQRGAYEEQLSALSRPFELPVNVAQEIERLQSEIDNERAVSYDFLTKYQALNRIAEAEGRGFALVSWFIFGFFALLEMVPLGLKWALGKTEYHYYVQARNNVNNQKIISITNHFMEMMQNDPSTAINDVPTEISDVIASSLEDESGPTHTISDARSVGERFDSITTPPRADGGDQGDGGASSDSPGGSTADDGGTEPKMPPSFS